MAWAEQSEDQRQMVLVVLEREAERLEREAMQLQEAAQRLGRPSLVERQELAANAFRDAIDVLTGAQ
ncbi:MAG: hypothetical protein KF718_15365 [Polyangiaceae bacterium]|nr:hypothetical protein [Polyangiaceae bacterium]